MTLRSSSGVHACEQKTHGGANQLELGARSGRIPNLQHGFHASAESERVQLFVTSVSGRGEAAAGVEAAEGFDASIEVATLGDAAPAQLEVIYASEVDEWSRPFDVEFDGAGAQLAAAAP